MNDNLLKDVKIVPISNGLIQLTVFHCLLVLIRKKEHFIVWMRISPLNKFRKLWGRIYQDLLPGDYYMAIENSILFIDKTLKSPTN